MSEYINPEHCSRCGDPTSLCCCSEECSVRSALARVIEAWDVHHGRPSVKNAVRLAEGIDQARLILNGGKVPK